VRKALLTTTLIAALAGATAPAQGHPGAGDHPGPGDHPHLGAHPGSGDHPSGANGHKCSRVRRVGFVVKGTFVSGDASSVALEVTKANEHAVKSGLVSVGANYTATVSDPSRIRYVNRSGPADAQPSDKVRVRGKVTKLKHGCSDEGFTPTVTVHRISVIGPDTQSSSESTSG
jgi:hypothetical protein